jgi:hypothetical protein
LKIHLGLEELAVLCFGTIITLKGLLEWEKLGFDLKSSEFK